MNKRHPLEMPKKSCKFYFGVMCPMVYSNIHTYDGIILGLPTGYKYSCEKGLCPFWREQETDSRSFINNNLKELP